MDTEKKDNLTDLVEEIENADTPEDDLDDKTSQTVRDGNGDEITLGEES